jgi:DNA-binding CsgD family transcriptional regulator
MNLASWVADVSKEFLILYTPRLGVTRMQKELFTVLVEHDGSVLWCSDYLPGVTPDQVVGHKLWEPVIPAHVARVVTAVSRASKGETVRYPVACLIGGVEVWFQVALRPVVIPTGSYVMSIAQVVHRPIPVAMTDTETEIITLLSAGLTHLQIGKQLGKSAGTISAHLYNIRKKLECETNAGVIAWGLLSGDRF